MNEQCDEPILNCQEQAQANLEEALDECEEESDDVERENCEKRAKQAFNEHNEQCDIADCYEEIESQIEPIF